MKLLKVFGLFLLLNLGAWAGSHIYLQQHQATVLVVVDTSYALKPQFTAMEAWINQFQLKSRYKHIIVGTDKAFIGDLDSLPAKSSIFRTVFGKMSADNLQRYAEIPAEEKILLSDGAIQPAGWKVIKFP